MCLAYILQCESASKYFQQEEHEEYCATFFTSVSKLPHYWEHSDTSLWLLNAQLSQTQAPIYRSEGGGGGRASGQLPIKMFNRIDWEEVLSINNHFTLLVEDPWHEAGPGPGDAADCNQDFFLVTTFMFPAFLWLVSPPPSGSTRSTANIGSVLGKGNFLTIKTCSRRWTWRASLEPHHHHVVK